MMSLGNHSNSLLFSLIFILLTLKNNFCTKFRYYISLLVGLRVRLDLLAPPPSRSPGKLKKPSPDRLKIKYHYINTQYVYISGKSIKKPTHWYQNHNHFTLFLKDVSKYIFENKFFDTHCITKKSLPHEFVFVKSIDFSAKLLTALKKR